MDFWRGWMGGTETCFGERKCRDGAGGFEGGRPRGHAPQSSRKHAWHPPQEARRRRAALSDIDRRVLAPTRPSKLSDGGKPDR